MTAIKIIKIGQDGCRPCKVVEYMLEANADIFAVEGATIESINLSQQPEMTERYGVMSTPVLVFERNGIEHSRINGVCNVDDVIGAIEKAREAR